MPTPTIPAGNLFMNATLYTGNGSTQTITNGVAGQSFQPDFVWIKNRTAAYNHNLVNSVAGATYYLESSTTAAEVNNSGVVSAITSTGFSVGNAASTNNSTNALVAWQWKAGGTAVSNTSGTITSSVSANTTSGFSVVTLTTTAGVKTVGHGLGVAPALIIVKPRAVVADWYVYGSSYSNTQYLKLNTTDALITDANLWNSTSATSSVFTLGSSWGSGNTLVAYCWAPIAGYSAFGSYTGNGSTDGPFVYTGFRPKYVMIRNVSRVVSWYVEDSVRNTYNVMGLDLNPNTSGAESNDAPVLDFVANGFKIRNTYDAFNQSGETLIYMAFAETPLKFANAR